MQAINVQRNVTNKQEYTSASLAEKQSVSRKPSDVNVSQPLLNTAEYNINAVVSSMVDPTLPNNTAPPAAERSQQKGRPNQCRRSSSQPQATSSIVYGQCVWDTTNKIDELSVAF